MLQCNDGATPSKTADPGFRRCASKTRFWLDPGHRCSKQKVVRRKLRLGHAVDGEDVGAVERDHAVAAGIRHEALQRAEVEPKAVEVDDIGAARSMAREAG